MKLDRAEVAPGLEHKRRPDDAQAGHRKFKERREVCRE
jgi:hypothetical protein